MTKGIKLDEILNNIKNNRVSNLSCIGIRTSQFFNSPIKRYYEDINFINTHIKLFKQSEYILPNEKLTVLNIVESIDYLYTNRLPHVYEFIKVLMELFIAYSYSINNTDQSSSAITSYVSLRQPTADEYSFIEDDISDPSGNSYCKSAFDYHAFEMIFPPNILNENTDLMDNSGIEDDIDHDDYITSLISNEIEESFKINQDIRKSKITKKPKERLDDIILRMSIDQNNLSDKNDIPKIMLLSTTDYINYLYNNSKNKGCKLFYNYCCRIFGQNYGYFDKDIILCDFITLYSKCKGDKKLLYNNFFRPILELTKTTTNLNLNQQ